MKIYRIFRTRVAWHSQRFRDTTALLVRTPIEALARCANWRDASARWAILFNDNNCFFACGFVIGGLALDINNSRDYYIIITG